MHTAEPAHVTNYVVAAALIERDGKYLLVQEKLAKAYGLWNLPAGKVDEGETLEEAAVREAKEEAGLTVTLGRKVGVYQYAADKPPKHVFLVAEAEGEVVFPEDEIMDARWFSLPELRAMKDSLRDPYILESIESVSAAALYHTTILVSDYEKAKAFYGDMFELLGWEAHPEIEGASYWSHHGFSWWIVPASPEDSASNAGGLGINHLAFKVRTPQLVDDLNGWLLENGHRVDIAPKSFPEYGESYYAVFFYDPDGTRLEVVSV